MRYYIYIGVFDIVVGGFWIFGVIVWFLKKKIWIVLDVVFCSNFVENKY